MVVHPESEAGTLSNNIIIDDSDYHLTYGNEDIESVHQDDHTLINENIDASMEDQNIYNDNKIINTDLPDIMDDVDMNEFNNI